MFNPFKKKLDRNKELLKTFDGRTVKYVTRREVDSIGNISHRIMGKSGRIAVVKDKIRIICGETDVFSSAVEDTKYSMLLSGDGVVIEGNNIVTNRYDIVTVYYSYYRK